MSSSSNFDDSHANRDLSVNDINVSDTGTLPRVDRVYSSEREGILSWLSAIDRNLQLRTISKRRVEGTGDFLFRTPQFNSWLETSGQSIFCPGSAGAGKTVLASLVIAQLQTIFRGDVKVGIIYFFSGFGRPEKLDPSKLLSSFLKQLVEEQLSVPKDVIGLFKEHFKKITKPSYTKLAKVFHSVASKYSRIFVILDNTDEPEVSVRQRALIYREINYLREEVALNLFTTSTFSPEMIGELKNNLMLEVRAPQEDIERYLDEMIKILPLVVSSNIVLMEDYKKNIVNAANRVFLLARLYSHSLIGELTPEAIQRRLDDLTRRSHLSADERQDMEVLNSAHDLVMKRIECQEQDYQELAKKALMWTTSSRRSLTLSELQHILSMESSKSSSEAGSLPSGPDIQVACSGLLEIDEVNNTVFIHSFTEEYLNRNKGQWYAEDIQNHISKKCIEYLRRGDYDDDFCFSDEEFECRLESHPFYEYAAQNWGEHAQLASAEVTDLVISFLNDDRKLVFSSQVLMASKQCSIDSRYSQRVPKNMTAVHIAAYFGLERVMPLLIAHKHSKDPKDSYGRTPLSYAAEHGRESIVQLLLEADGVDLDCVDVMNRTPLAWSAEHGHSEVVQLLLSSGAKVDTKDSVGRTPLLCAAANGYENVVESLLRAGAGDYPNIKDTYGQTALSCAAAMGHGSVVQLLLNKRTVDPHSKDDNGNTPLSHAAANGHRSTLQLLLDVPDVDPDSPNINGFTPLSRAAANGRKEIVQLLTKTAGVNNNSKDINGITPLSRAAANGHLSVVRVLLDADDVDLEAQDVYGQTACMRAAAKGHTAVVQTLRLKIRSSDDVTS